uniref:Uncharacterized protein n=1 Tax=Thermosporothrix sp. COM3 TaxID=2490863 RepID=A0A455SH22_9CHLR|nr:hypothetical protein KTC_25080 [Thermosporothrix sp. COM3]
MEGFLGLQESQEYTELLNYSPNIERVHESVLQVVLYIFSASDKRAVNGLQFLAHLLHLATIKQMSLFSDELEDVAVIRVPSIRALCYSGKYDWKWCYDTTCKYFSLLSLAGVLYRPTSQKRGEGTTLYFPLGAYRPPEHINVEVLENSRPKLKKSGALKRMTNAESVFEPGQLSSDQAEIRRSMKKVVQLLKREAPESAQKLAQAIANILTDHTARVVKKLAGEPVGRTEDAASEANAQSDQPPIVETTIAEPCTAKQAALPAPVRPTDTVAAAVPTTEQADAVAAIAPTIKQADTVAASMQTIEQADAVAAIAPTTEQATETKTPSQWQEDFPFSIPEIEELTITLTPEEEVTLSKALSLYFNNDESKIGHYRKLLQEDAQALHLAIVDCLIRSHFPDSGHQREPLGGGWVTRQYKRYHEKVGALREIEAWADWLLERETGPALIHEYMLLDDILKQVGQWQDSQGMTVRKRPMPEEVVIDHSYLRNFWHQNGAQGLLLYGHLFVDVEGDILPAEEYEQLRLNALETFVTGEKSEELSESMCYELQTYVDWVQQYAYTLEEKAELMQRIPREVFDWIGTLRQQLSNQHYKVRLLIAPMDRRHILEVLDLEDMRRSWILRSAEDVATFIGQREWEQAITEEEETEEAEEGHEG